MGADAATFSRTIGTDDTLTSVAEALAASINASAFNSDNFTATHEGATLVIVNRAGNLFTPSFSITPYGLPKVGEVWTVSLPVQQDNVSATPRSYSYTVVAGDTPQSIASALAFLINRDGLPEYRATTDGHVLIIENVAGNPFTATFALTKVAGSTGSAVIEAANARVATRVDGINYYGIDTMNIDFGAGADVMNVQGTSARTNINLRDGDDSIFVSSTANFGLGETTDFLTGHLHDIDGMLNIDAGVGRHVLLVSDEASTVGDANVWITDGPLSGTAEPQAEIYMLGLADGAITYKADANNGNFAKGITVWTGFGNDKIDIEGTHIRSGVRTVTTLNTGLGDDIINVDLDTDANDADAAGDDFFVLNTQGPYNDFLATSDNDIVRGANSTLPLIIFGGQGNDDHRQRLRQGHRLRRPRPSLLLRR